VSSAPHADAPGDRWYSVDHHWAQVVTQIVPATSNTPGSPQLVRIGLTSYAQDAIGVLRFVALPKVGQTIAANEACGEVEASKAVSDVYSPIAGVVAAVNERLRGNPGLLNEDPYGLGWICEIDTQSALPVPNDSRDRSPLGLLSAVRYLELLGGTSETVEARETATQTSP
jgi:glycine cleavage system H protein